MKSFKAQPADAGLRADVFIAKQYPDFSRSSLDGLFVGGLVWVGSKAAKGAYKIKEGDRIKVDDKKLFIKPPEIDLPIIYEDDDVLVIDKSAGILTHSKGMLNSEATVASFIESKLSKDMSSGNRAGIVHRLDRATSGVIITAKNPAALKWLQKQFSNHRTKKQYIAVVKGRPEPNRAVIDAPIGRNPRKPQTFRVDPAGKPAQTEYRTLKTFESTDNSLVELKPKTGRTHQLRVHLAYVNHPVVGDRIYGHEAENMYLHAKRLELTLPSGERKVFESGEPNCFKEFIKDA